MLPMREGSKRVSHMEEGSKCDANRGGIQVSPNRLGRSEALRRTETGRSQPIKVHVPSLLSACRRRCSSECLWLISAQPCGWGSHTLPGCTSMPLHISNIKQA
jgi:hypothetical protein